MLRALRCDDIATALSALIQRYSLHRTFPLLVTILKFGLAPHCGPLMARDPVFVYLHRAQGLAMHPERTLLTGSPYCVLVLENGGARHRVRGCDCHRLSCLAPILNRSTTKAQKPITRGAARIGQIAALSLD